MAAGRAVSECLIVVVCITLSLQICRALPVDANHVRTKRLLDSSHHQGTTLF